MNINNIYLKFTINGQPCENNSQFARDVLGISPTQWERYRKNRKPTKTDLKLASAMAENGMYAERILFSDQFDHADATDPAKPHYWLNAAMSCFDEAAKRGADYHVCEGFKQRIIEQFRRSLKDYFAGSDENGRFFVVNED